MESAKPKSKVGFILKEGRKTAIYTALEFSDCVQNRRRDKSTITLPLTALRNVLEQSDLPHPITLFVATGKRDLTTATLLQGNGKQERIAEKYLAMKNIPAGAQAAR